MFGGIAVGMFGAVSIGSAASRVPPTQAGGGVSANPASRKGNAPASATSSGKEKMERRLLAHFIGADVPNKHLDKLGDAGVTTISLFASFGGGETEFRRVLARPGIDIVATDLASSVLQARIVQTM